MVLHCREIMYLAIYLKICHIPKYQTIHLLLTKLTHCMLVCSCQSPWILPAKEYVWIGFHVLWVGEYQDFSWNIMIMIIIKNQFDRKETRDNPEGINLLILKQIKDHEHILHSKPPHSWPNQLFFSDSCLCVVKLSATSLKACYHKNTFKRTIIWSHFSHFHSYMNSSNKNQV